ncbi:DUF6415 family natural product biosynthesis protein [Streptomyces sp. NPDC088400]|uniref:DUF6415 family natural product biosynthesis protein n=1 Tax=Streptomyces sp. NPDC088400 TaxID=3365861 RepID=UPI003817FD18
MTALLSGRRFVGPAERWLLSTVRDAQLAQDDWDSCRPALLRLGKKFDVVKMPARFVHAAVASATPVDVCAALSRTLCGPVICDPRIWYYALVPLGTAVTWTCRHGAARGAGTWCAVPRTDYTAPKGRRPYWAVPADTPFRLCDPEAVAVLLQTGHERLEATEQKKLAHRALLDHLETCSACTVETSLRAIADDCETALASHQSAASQAALTDRADLLRRHLTLLVSAVKEAGAGECADGARVAGAVRDAAQLLAAAPQEDRIGAWVQLRALARVTRILVDARHSRRNQPTPQSCETGTALRYAVRRAR